MTRPSREVAMEIATEIFVTWSDELAWDEKDVEDVAKPITAALDQARREGRSEGLLEAEAELQRAFSECDTLNLLHGAARVLALLPEPEGKP